MASQKPPSSRLSMPDPRPMVAGLGLALLGAIMIGARMPGWLDLGWALLVIGGCTVGWWVSQARGVARYRKQLDREAQRKAALNTTRRQKEAEERAQREVDKKAKEEHAALLREQRAEEGRRRKDAEEAEARARAEEQERIEAEMARLKSLDAAALQQEVVDRFASRRYQVTSTDGGEIRLNSAAGSEAVCRIVNGHMSRAHDVRDLEAWRRDAAAKEAFLVCLNGFAPDAVRAAQGKPITLVESHLLAAWTTAGGI